jgi:hypothetical protein
MSETITINPHNVLDADAHAVVITADDQEFAIRRGLEMFNAMKQAGMPLPRIIKTAYVTIIGMAINAALETSPADTKAMLSDLLIRTLDRIENAMPDLENMAHEIALRHAEPAGNA